VRTMFFEHVLQLPLSYYTGSHSGRLVKVMMTGTNTLWGLWLSFFREHFEHADVESDEFHEADLGPRTTRTPRTSGLLGSNSAH
jgi:hypothetical protein